MSDKREKLRNGEPVELQPGVFGRLNKEDQTLELSNGKKLAISDKNRRDLFPANEEAKKYAQEREKIQTGIKESPFGEFGEQFSNSGIVGGLIDFGSRYLSGRTPEEYQRFKRAQQEVGQEISEESPWTSRAATAASFVPDFIATRGLSAAKAAPLITGLAAGTRSIDEPLEVAKEVGASAIGGKLIDKGAQFLSNAANRRAASRALPGQQQAVRQQNALGQQQVNQQAQKVRQEYALAKQQHKEAVRNLPAIQQKAQAQYSKGVVKNAQELENLFPKDAKIALEELGAKEFIDTNINKAGLSGSVGGKQASKVLSSVFKEGETLSARDLSKRYQALENAIQNSSLGAKEILTEFKNHLGQRIPLVLENNIAFSKVMPPLIKEFDKDIGAVLSQMKGVSPQAATSIRQNAADALKNIDSRNFSERLKSGELLKELTNNISSAENFAPTGIDAETFRHVLKDGEQGKWYKAFKNFISQAEKTQKEFVTRLEGRIQNKMAQNELKAVVANIDTAKKADKKLQGTYGNAAPVAQPPPPLAPIMQTQPSPLPPNTPPPPGSPPIIPNFTPTPEPTLPPAANAAENAGDFLERNLLSGRGLVNNPLTKLGALKYALGNAALPVEGTYLAMKGLTSPTAGGEAARLAFAQAGIEAIDSWARKYPSYHEGILESPQDRRSLTKEIEDAQDIPLEQKAIIQSKVNRGKPLSSPQAPPSI